MIAAVVALLSKTNFPEGTIEFILILSLNTLSGHSCCLYFVLIPIPSIYATRLNVRCSFFLGVKKNRRVSLASRMHVLSGISTHLPHRTP